jgi:chorismate mutase
MRHRSVELLQAAIETHCSPQQSGDGLTSAKIPATKRLMTDAASTAGEIPPELMELRHSIDNIDAAVLHLLAERFKCTQKVGQLKARLNLPPADPTREAQQITRLRALAADAALAPEFAEKFLGFLTKEVIRHHEIIRNRQS